MIIHVANPFDTLYKRAIKRASDLSYSLPTRDCQDLEIELLKNLNDAAILGNLDLFLVFANNAGLNFSLINLVKPETDLATLNGTNLPNWSTNGFTGTGSGYIRTDHISTTLNSFGGHINTNTAESGKYMFGKKTAANAFQSSILTRTSGNVVQAFNNKNDWMNVSETDQTGFWHNDRSDSNGFKVFKNGSLKGNLGAAAPQNVGLPFYILALNTDNNSGSGFSVNQISCFFSGSSLNGKEASFHNAWNTYFTALQLL